MAINVRELTEKAQKIEEAGLQIEKEIEQSAIETLRKGIGIKGVQIVLNWLAFFPLLLIERFTSYRIPRALAYLALSVLAFAGMYDFLYGILAYPLYNMAADFSNESLLNSLAVLAVVKGVEIAGAYTPGLQAIGEIMQQLGDYLANGVLALGLQSTFLLVVQKGFFLRYLLGFGFFLLMIPNLAGWGSKLVFGSLILFIVMPLVVTTEAFVYNSLKAPVQRDLKASYEQIEEAVIKGGWGSVKQGALSLKEGALSITKKTANLFKSGDSESEEEKEVKPSEVEQKVTEKERQGFFATIKQLAGLIVSGLLMLFLITLFTCIVAPIIAYILVFRIFREVFKHDYLESVSVDGGE